MILMDHVAVVQSNIAPSISFIQSLSLGAYFDPRRPWTTLPRLARGLARTDPAACKTLRERASSRSEPSTCNLQPATSPSEPSTSPSERVNVPTFNRSNASFHSFSLQL